MPIMLRAFVVSTVACIAVSGCYATAGPEPVGYAEVTAAPVNIETYPSTTYEGRPVYLYQDRWYYRDGARWNYYRNEPAPLYEHRRRVVAPRHDGEVRREGEMRREGEVRREEQHEDRERHERR